MVIRKKAQLAFAACLWLAIGCSDSPGEHKAVVETKVSPSPLEQIKFEISNLASNVTAGFSPGYEYFSGLAKRVGELSSLEREDAFKFAVETLEKPPLKEFPLSDRLMSLQAYDATVSRLVHVFLTTLGSKDGVWDFSLRTISVFDDEIMAVNAPGFDPRNPDWGIGITIGIYMSEVYNLHFRAVHERLEDNKLVAQYYHGLSSDRQEYWNGRIEKIVHRRIDIPAARKSDESRSRKKTAVKRSKKNAKCEKWLHGVELHGALRSLLMGPAEEGL